MLYKHFTEKILGLQDILIENIKSTNNTIHVYCKLERKLHKCPCCGNFTDKIHDYREQIIKDIPAFGKFVFIHLKSVDTIALVANALLKIIRFFLVITV